MAATCSPDIFTGVLLWRTCINYSHIWITQILQNPFFVGEKVMIQTPTWFFPAGAGPYAEESHITHGEPSPMATFRFAEPIYIDKQQNFRMEIEIPNSDTLKELQRTYGPLFIWTIVDGYMTRDVQ